MGLQFPPAQEGLRVGHLDDPRAGASFQAIEQRALFMDVQEHLLNKVVGLIFIPKNPNANIPDNTGIAPEEQGESVTVTGLNVCN